jgi:hypothetical protein
MAQVTWSVQQPTGVTPTSVAYGHLAVRFAHGAIAGGVRVTPEQFLGDKETGDATSPYRMLRSASEFDRPTLTRVTTIAYEPHGARFTAAQALAVVAAAQEGVERKVIEMRKNAAPVIQVTVPPTVVAPPPTVDAWLAAPDGALELVFRTRHGSSVHQVLRVTAAALEVRLRDPYANVDARDAVDLMRVAAPWDAATAERFLADLRAVYDANVALGAATHDRLASVCVW